MQQANSVGLKHSLLSTRCTVLGPSKVMEHASIAQSLCIKKHALVGYSSRKSIDRISRKEMDNTGLIDTLLEKLRETVNFHFFYRATRSNRNSVFPFVCGSITCMLRNKTKEHTVAILIPHERAITLVFLY